MLLLVDRSIIDEELAGTGAYVGSEQHPSVFQYFEVLPNRDHRHIHSLRQLNHPHSAGLLELIEDVFMSLCDGHGRRMTQMMAVNTHWIL